MSEYTEFLESKMHCGVDHGFEPLWMQDDLFDFQRDLVEWALRKGRGALFEDCGLGKTIQQLVWSENVVRKTNGRTLILTPLAVTSQTAREATKFGMEAAVSRDGKLDGFPKTVITNYERLHYFDPSDFAAIVADESGILKNFDGATKAAVTEFARKLPYRLLCTATPSPNDYIELGTSSEALGEMGFMDVLNRFFKKAEKTMSRRQELRTGIYRFRGHAERDFWRWVCSWARSVRKPSDLGYSNEGFDLPPLMTAEHVIKARNLREGYLFDLPAFGLQEQREERRRTITERCEKAAELVTNTGEPAVCWCHLNDEGDMIERLIPDAVQIAGKDSDDRKEEIFQAFQDGEIRVLVSKSSIAGFGVNWQHCAHQTFFPSHSFESWYQSIRRSWRFGQTKPVKIDVITTEGEKNILNNLQRKQEQAGRMFDNLVEMMNDELKIQTKPYGGIREEIPTWL
ncbi:MAG: DEAD/DEAH box helicase [Planctomycetota bacterium]|nr:DEAD/DEAH box helicase [Planctomycetota bacterium]